MASTAQVQLAQLKRKLEALGGEAFFQGCSLSLAEESRKLIVKGFAGSVDPYGRRWKPTVDAAGNHQPLRRTGRLQNSMVPRPFSRGIRIDANVSYAAFHQEGTKRIPRRQFLPTNEQGLGDAWNKAYRGALASAIRRGMR